MVQSIVPKIGRRFSVRKRCHINKLQHRIRCCRALFDPSNSESSQHSLFWRIFLIGKSVDFCGKYSKGMPARESGKVATAPQPFSLYNHARRFLRVALLPTCPRPLAFARAER
jgi:hypothetical protein